MTLANLLIFIAGLMVGGTAGVVGVSLCVAAGSSEKEIAPADAGAISRENSSRHSNPPGDSILSNNSTQRNIIKNNMGGGDTP